MYTKFTLPEGWSLGCQGTYYDGFWVVRPDGTEVCRIGSKHTYTEIEELVLAINRQWSEGAKWAQEQAARYCETADGLPLNKPVLAEDIAQVIRDMTIPDSSEQAAKIGEWQEEPFPAAPMAEGE